MLVTFSTDAYENITYFHSVAQDLLALMGHSGTVPGAIKARDLPDALNRLKQGLGQEQRDALSSDDEEQDISLAKRAIPLIHLLEAAIKKDCDVLWNAY